MKTPSLNNIGPHASVPTNSPAVGTPPDQGESSEASMAVTVPTVPDSVEGLMALLRAVQASNDSARHILATFLKDQEARGWPQFREVRNACAQILVESKNFSSEMLRLQLRLDHIQSNLKQR